MNRLDVEYSTYRATVREQHHEFKHYNLECCCHLKDYGKDAHILFLRTNKKLLEREQVVSCPSKLKVRKIGLKIFFFILKA